MEKKLFSIYYLEKKLLVHNTSIDRVYFLRKFLNQWAECFGCLFNPSLQSTQLIPNRTVQPELHSKLSNNDQAKYPFTLTPSLYHRKEINTIQISAQREREREIYGYKINFILDCYIIILFKDCFVGKSNFLFVNVKHLLDSPKEVPKMAMVILNSLVVSKGFLKR